MLDERLIDILVDRLVQRIESTNTYILEQIGESIKYIGTLTPSKANQLIYILKYGGNFDKIVKRLAEVTKLNISEIYEIFEEVAKNDYRFAKQFYDYRGVKYIPYEENIALKRQIEALATITAGQYTNISNTLAFAKKVNGRIVYTDLSRTYQEVVDKAILSIAQGKETFDTEMRKAIKELSSSGIRTVDYASGRSQRLDSALRMNLKGALRNLHNETQAIFGREFGSDGVEISVHLNPAPDHAEVQGRQFSKEEFEKFQNDQDARDYKGRIFPHEHNGKDRRSISEYNCYHYTFDVVLGVSEPEYNDKELQQIIDNNNKGFELDGKHYTMYEGTQMQRKLETEIRKKKDTQIMARSVGDEELARESQKDINILTKRYKELSDISGLPTAVQRARVNGYKRISTKEFDKDKFIEFNPSNTKEMAEIGNKYFDFKSNSYIDDYVTKTSNIKERITNGDTNIKDTLDIIEPKVDELATPSPMSFKMYSAKDISVDYSQDKHLLSATISKPIANIHNNKRLNKETITIYVEKGAKIISTVNTKGRHFDKQGELILPTTKKLVRINKYEYILKK